MRFNFRRLNLNKLCYIAALLMLCGVAFAQGDPTKPYWGAGDPLIVSTILGIIGPYITSFINKSSYSDARKRLVLVVIALLATFGTGVYVHALTLSGAEPRVIITTFCQFFTVATLTYQSLTDHFSNVTKTVGFTDKSPVAH